jgi:hypothetical protein
MPVHRCQENGKPGWQWGSKGACYTYQAGNAHSMHEAMQKAVLQGYAAEKNGAEGGHADIEIKR